MDYVLLYLIVSMFTLVVCMYAVNLTGIFDEHPDERAEMAAYTVACLLWPVFWAYVIYLFIRRKKT